MLAHSGFGRRREDRLGQLGRITQARRQGHATHALLRLVFGPAAACQIAAHHGFYRQGLQAFDEHAAALHLRHLIGLHHAFGRIAREMVGADVAEFAKPEQGHLREQSALAGDWLVHDHIKRADAVAGHHQDAVIAHGVVVAYLAARQERQRMQLRCVQGVGRRESRCG